MNRTRFIRLLCAFLASVLLLCACTASDEPEEKPLPNSVTLWAVESDPIAGELSALVGQYNAAAPSVEVELRLFPDEQSLADAMDSARPDLLLCREDHALALYDQGRLKALDASGGELPGCLPAFQEFSPCVGVSYFPLCADVQLLAVSPAAVEQTDPAVLASMDRICAVAADASEPYFAADSYAALFAVCLAQTGEEFRAIRSEDTLSKGYRRLYNLLAGAAYAGGLGYAEDDWLAAVSEGGVSCLLSTSTRLCAVKDKLLFYPMPVMQDGEKLCMAEIYGLAVTSPFTGGLPYAADFLRWLCAARTSAAPLLEKGYLPAAEGAWPELPGSYAGAMHATADSYRFYLPAVDSGYRLRGEDFEEDFRTALALLN